MNKQFILILLISMVTFAHCQDIKVISKENSGNTIINFKTTNGKQVPIFRPMGQIDFNAGTDQVFLKKVQEIGSAPLSLELNNGYYTFQLYDWGPTFKIDAQGGNQDWVLRPGKKEYLTVGLIGGLVSFSTISISTIGMFITSPYLYDSMGFSSSQSFANETGQIVSGVGIGIGVVGLISSVIYYLKNKPKAKMLKSY